MRLFWPLVVCSFLSTSALTVYAQGGCPVNDKEFLHQITASADWVDVHAVFKRNFPACQDEGLYADGYTNMVVGVLATNWQDIEALDRLTAKDEGFKAFVMRHIGISAGEEDLQRILGAAQKDCPKQSLSLCKEIARRSKQALGAKR